MNGTSDLLKEEKEKLGLRVIKGGREAPMSGDPTPPCWLKGLPEGQVFLVKDTQTKSFILHQFDVDWIHGEAYRLSSYPDDSKLWVDPQWFCNRFSLVEDLGNIRNKIEDIDND